MDIHAQHHQLHQSTLLSLVVLIYGRDTPKDHSIQRILNISGEFIVLPHLNPQQFTSLGSHCRSFKVLAKSVVLIFAVAITNQIEERKPNPLKFEG